MRPLRLIRTSALILLAASAATGCVRMSRATPQLSAELGSRIAEMQGLHQLTLTRFFDAERQRVEEFMDREWIPLFLRNFLGTSGLLNDLAAAGRVSEADREAIRLAIVTYLADSSEADRLTAEIVQTVTRSRSVEDTLVRRVVARFVDDARVDRATSHVTSLLRSADPGLLVLEWAGDAQTQINLRRKQLLDPINAAERQAASELAQAYGDMAAANGAITGRLEAAAKVTAQQDELLGALGAGDLAARTRQRLASVSEAVGSALSQGSQNMAAGRPPADILRILTETLGSRLAAIGGSR